VYGKIVQKTPITHAEVINLRLGRHFLLKLMLNTDSLPELMCNNGRK